VLGIEIYNDYSGRKDWSANPNYQSPDEEAQGFSLNFWDRVLATGRRCWGSCVPDHSASRPGNWPGRNILLVPEFTEYECLKAYRDGRFYGCLHDCGLKVTDVTATDTSLSVSASDPATFRFISDAGVIRESYGLSAACDFQRKMIFLRVEVANSAGERLFLQPLLAD